MKMNHLQHFKKKRKTHGNAVFLLFTLILAVLIVVPFFHTKARAFVVTLAFPFLSAGGEVAHFLSPSHFFVFKKTLLEENLRLKEEIELLRLTAQEYNFVVQENIELKEIFNFSDVSGLFASVIGAPPHYPYDTILLDRGVKNGVKKGDLLLTTTRYATNTPYTKYAIGVISEVYENASRGILFSTPGKKIETFVGPQNVRVLLRGTGGGSFIAEAPKDLDVREGDQATIQGTAYIVGFAMKRMETALEQYATLYFTLPVNPFNIKYVNIISSDKENVFFASTSASTL